MLQKRSTYYYCLLLGQLLILAMLVGCSVSELDNTGNNNVASEINLTPTAMVTAIPLIVTQTVSTTSSPVATETSSVMPTQRPTAVLVRSVTSIPIPTSVPTLTPMPTIPPQQRGQRYIELMSDNGNCELPCWWGFELGNTSLDEIRQFYTTFDTYITESRGSNGISVLEALFVDPQIERGEQTRHLFVAQDNIVIEAKIQLKYYSDHQIEPMLAYLGQPSDVWMRTIPESYEGILPIHLQLYFPEKGVLVSYATQGVLIDDVINGCFDTLGDASIHLWDPSVWDPNGDKGIEERFSQASSSFRYHPIEDVSNWDAEELYTILTDPNHLECLETPSNLWTLPL